MQEKDKLFLESKKSGNRFKEFKAGLEKMNSTPEAVINKLVSFLSKKNKDRLTGKVAELGLLLLNEMPGYKDENSRYSGHVSYKNKRYNRIEEILGNDEWNNADNYQLLIYFFGEEKAAYVRHAWERMRYQMYLTGWSRRSFRSPENKEMYFRNQVNLIIDLIPQAFTKVADYVGGSYKEIYTFYDLNIAEQIKYAQFLSDGNEGLFMLWAAAIDLNADGILQLAEDIIFNKDDTGKVTRSLIKGLLGSEKKAAWQLVEKLLLAAQRQEGLRQTILEGLDETSIGALKYMIQVIIEHKLARFSSVVRSVDVWAGLGWESEKEATVNKFLEKATLYLEQPELIPQAIESENNADVYMALWAQGVYDVEKTIPFLQQLQQKGNAEKRCLALLFASITGHYKLQMPLYYPALQDEDLLPLACAANSVYSVVQVSENHSYYNKYYPELFNALHDAYKRAPLKTKTFASIVFSWQTIKFEKKTLVLSMLKLVNNQERLNVVLNYFDELDAQAKSSLSTIILPNHVAYYHGKKQNPDLPLTAFQRNYAMLLLKDRSEYETAFRALKQTAFSLDEATVLPDLFKRKAAAFRSKIIALLFNQPENVIGFVMDQILQGDTEQRLAGLDILIQLQKSKKLQKDSVKWVSTFKERKTISQKETILLEQLDASVVKKDLSEKNGYGFYDPAKLSPVIKPVTKAASFYEKLIAKHEFGFSKPFTDVKKALQQLTNLLEQYRDHEYEVEWYDNSRETLLLGNNFRKKSWNKKNETGREAFEDYPLYEVWEQWYKESGLQPQDLFIIHLCHFQTDLIKQLPKRKELVPTKYLERWRYNNPVNEVMNALRHIYPFEQQNSFCIGATTRLFAQLPSEILTKKIKENYYPKSVRGWQEDEQWNIFLKHINLWSLHDEEIKECWNLYHWRQHACLPECVSLYKPPLMIYCMAFQAGIIAEEEMYSGIMISESIRILSSKKKHQQATEDYEKFPFIPAMFERVRDYILDVELKRGDTATAVTPLAASFEMIVGIHRFTSILAGLGKTSLSKGYYYWMSDEGHSKQAVFSALLKKCHPLPGETQALFDKAMQQLQVTESRLIEAAVYAPQWQNFISSYLGWKGLDSAIWWMHAHTKTQTYRTENLEAESEIAKYSSLAVEEFKTGAVDKAWFLKAYKEIGKQRWPLVYDAAKYISDGNGHRRARIYADVLLGELSFKEVTDKITEKRDQDYVRIYGLAPLSKKNAEKDILARYEFLQQFKKESRQFGAQKQTSEGLAFQVALENLSRNAGYADPIRLTWSMETKQVQQILSKETQVQYEDFMIGLIIDEEGLADVVAFKGEKELKAIPSKYKKDSKVEELMGFRKTLREQFKRSRKGLEDAMLRGDVFSLAEIQNLFSHPVISKHLEKLIFITADCTKHGFYQAGKLINAAETEIILADSDSLRIAHCTDLYKSGKWSAYQAAAFDKKLKQPFKQLFRELYLPTKDELAEKSISRRYAGHQVQPKQTAALLRSRGWKADYEEGLQKVFHKEGFAAKLYAMADWFSPAEIESPTLETIQFIDLKTFKNVAFTDINERIFSEVMRDMDLVVSVAHAGGVDAEASHSTIEMRTVLLNETLRLFKINNVVIACSHAKIKGSLGEYSVHLGSAVVHQVSAGYLSILPVQSQHRGRLFLPFVDDDPKSAEVISKVLLLARDQDIQDPTILSQLQHA
jgi:hypothetical protein